jgi:hypothetical protein
LTEEQNKNIIWPVSQRDRFMSQDAAPEPPPDSNRLEVATDEAIAACGGNARDAVKAPIVANEYLESEVAELMKAVSHAFTRGRFKSYTG